MIEVSNKPYIFGYVLSKFTIRNIKSLIILDKDDNDNEYRKTIKYMPNKSLIDNALFNIVNVEPIYVRRVVSYIIMHLPYGNNYITLKGSDIANAEGMVVADVSRGINRLVELGIIESCADLPVFAGKKVRKNVYVINHNYIFRGDIKKLVKDFKAQNETNSITNE